MSSLYPSWASTTPPREFLPIFPTCRRRIMTSQCVSTAIQPLANSFPYYESHDARYPAPATYGSSYSTRSTTPTIPSDQHSSCRLPPLTVLTTSERDGRWQSAHYPIQPATHMSTGIRSPTASYPLSYPSYTQAESYSYPAVPDMRDAHPVTAMNHQSQVMPMPHSSLPARTDSRPSQSRAHSSLSHGPYPSVMTSEEPIIKKKRKRADANQLKVLNEVYNRTAFPSTDERAELARKLDMSARSVQIW
jgi:homeobox protein YOX1/YHP1